MKRLSGSALAILGGGFSNVCFILMRLTCSKKSTYLYYLKNYVSGNCLVIIKVVTVTFKKFMKTL